VVFVNGVGIWGYKISTNMSSSFSKGRIFEQYDKRGLSGLKEHPDL
jgi:hypothetical protein